MRTTPLSRRSLSGVERKICSPVSENWDDTVLAPSVVAGAGAKMLAPWGFSH